MFNVNHALCGFFTGHRYSVHEFTNVPPQIRCMDCGAVIPIDKQFTVASGPYRKMEEQRNLQERIGSTKEVGSGEEG